MSLTGKVALVTGGSRGIGFATAKVLAENGASVVITGKDQDRLDKASSEISNSFAVVADVRKTDEVKNAVKKTVEKFGRLDILVNNAGAFPRIKKLHEIEEEELVNQIKNTKNNEEVEKIFEDYLKREDIKN